MMKNLLPLDSFVFESRSEGWRREGGVLVNEIQFGSFSEAVNFVNQIAEVAEEMNHHPKIILDYDKVRVETFTHDEGKITDKDLELARRIC